MNNILISIVLPCFNEEEALKLFYNEISKVTNKMYLEENILFEYIFIDDGSIDNTLNILKELANIDNTVKYFSFSRNFGKEAAMLAGIKQSIGAYVIVMDVDLQDPPELINDMYQIIKLQEYDCIATRRVNRIGEPPIRSFFARQFYKLINKISKTEIVDGARDFRLMTRQMVNSIIEVNEYNRFSKGIFGWVGFKTKWLEYENTPRIAGTTKWSFWKLVTYSIEGIVAFSTIPLAISSLLGLLFCLIAFILIIFIIIRTLIYGDPTSGWPSLVCIIFFVSGIQLFSIGIIGQYIAKTYLEVKQRPHYIIKETNSQSIENKI